MILDQSAAFDCIPHHLLLKKLQVYNIRNSALQWITSYLELRTQHVVVGRAEVRGIPQGSVLGPLLYSVFINEMSECVRDVECSNESHENNEDLFGNDCKMCGMVAQYADDTTFHIANRHRQNNQTKLTENIENLRLFLNSNHMTINMDKMHILECTRYKIQDTSVYLGISRYPEWVVYRKMPEQVLLKSIKVCMYK